MNSRILISIDLDQRLQTIAEILKKKEVTNPHPDLLYFDDETKLGVEQAKQIREFLSIKPYQAKGRVVILISAQNLTPDAQNALLKTLEEPPLESLIILGVDKEESLLPTVLSRCEAEYRGKSIEYRGENRFKKEIEHLLESNIKERFNYIEKLEEKEEFLKALIIYFREQLKSNPKTHFLKILLEAEKWQKSNVNQRAILEYLMLELPNS
jgi:DNA polymerase III delta prime subunit